MRGEKVKDTKGIYKQRRLDNPGLVKDDCQERQMLSL